MTELVAWRRHRAGYQALILRRFGLTWSLETFYSDDHAEGAYFIDKASARARLEELKKRQERCFTLVPSNEPRDTAPGE